MMCLLHSRTRGRGIRPGRSSKSRATPWETRQARPLIRMARARGSMSGKNAPGKEEPMNSDANRPTPWTTILSIDDQPANLHVLVDCLTKYGHHVITATSGEE